MGQADSLSELRVPHRTRTRNEAIATRGASAAGVDVAHRHDRGAGRDTAEFARRGGPIVSAQETHFQGAEILQSTRTHVRWTLQKLSAPVSFSCHQCGRATTDTVVAIKTTSAGRKLAHCADCHLQRFTSAASTHEPHAPAVGTASAPDGAEGAATSRLDQTVLIRQPDPGQPHDVVETASELQWTFVIRRHHVEHGQCPLPSQAARRIRTAKVVHLDHGRGFPTVLLDSLRKKVTKEHLRGIRWPRAELMPGTRITAKLDRSRPRLSLTPLERPVFIAKKRFSYAYDPRIIARELPTSLAHSPAGIGVSLETRSAARRQAARRCPGGWPVRRSGEDRAAR